MSDQPASRPAAPFSLRLTQEERVRLERDAAGMSLGSYIRWRLFDPASPPPRSRGKFPVKDHAALARALALLGSSRISGNLNQLAKAVHLGTLPVGDETGVELREACEHVAAIRRMLIEALNLADSPSPGVQ